MCAVLRMPLGCEKRVLAIVKNCKAFLPTLLGQGEYYSTCDVDEALWSDRNWGHDAYTVNYSTVYEWGGGPFEQFEYV